MAGRPGDAAGEPVPCASAVVRDAAGRVLLVRRARAPAVGRWSLPGGRVEPGETAAAAAVREVAEETGLRVEARRRLGTVHRPGEGVGPGFLIESYECVIVGGTLRAGDDAAAVRWASAAELGRLPVTEGLAHTLAGWGFG